ncbi:MAG: late competence development ComFB family protein [Thermosynechococcaceae cyanobacterium MS004]|nr:late competence development ComFB family protein [Thermosynechococcaceae cyanobacterium MS004]
MTETSDQQPSPKANSYKNVMELLVDEEIDQQTRHYSKQDAQAINRIEVAAYALNTLPSLYASSQEGVGIQYQRGRQDLSDRITASVLEALTIIGKQPQRDSTPFSLLQSSHSSQSSASG